MGKSRQSNDDWLFVIDMIQSLGASLEERKWLVVIVWTRPDGFNESIVVKSGLGIRMFDPCGTFSSREITINGTEVC